MEEVTAAPLLTRAPNLKRLGNGRFDTSGARTRSQDVGSSKIYSEVK